MSKFSVILSIENGLFSTQNCDNSKNYSMQIRVPWHKKNKNSNVEFEKRSADAEQSKVYLFL